MTDENRDKSFDVIQTLAINISKLGGQSFSAPQIRCLMDLASRFYMDTIITINSAGFEVEWCTDCEVEYSVHHECKEGFRS